MHIGRFYFQREFDKRKSSEPEAYVDLGPEFLVQVKYASIKRKKSNTKKKHVPWWRLAWRRRLINNNTFLTIVISERKRNRNGAQLITKTIKYVRSPVALNINIILHLCNDDDDDDDDDTCGSYNRFKRFGEFKSMSNCVCTVYIYIYIIHPDAVF